MEVIEGFRQLAANRCELQARREAQNHRARNALLRVIHIAASPFIYIACSGRPFRKRYCYPRTIASRICGDNFPHRLVLTISISEFDSPERQATCGGTELHDREPFQGELSIAQRQDKLARIEFASRLFAGNNGGMDMHGNQAPLEYLVTSSQTSLEAFELARLNRCANLRKEVREVLEEWIQMEVDARLARWILECRRVQSGSSGSLPGTPHNAGKDGQAIPFLAKRSGSRGEAVSSHIAGLTESVGEESSEQVSGDGAPDPSPALQKGQITTKSMANDPATPPVQPNGATAVLRFLEQALDRPQQGVENSKLNQQCDQSASANAPCDQGQGGEERQSVGTANTRFSTTGPAGLRRKPYAAPHARPVFCVVTRYKREPK
jgi:hypothetical protein